MPSMNRGTYQLKPDDPPSVRNLWERYRDLEEQFPPELSGEALPYFHDWLLHRVGLVGIEAHDQGHGWEIFETMNDRPQPAAAPQRGRDHQVWLGRHGDHPGRVAACDHHARGCSEGQPVSGLPAQRAGHGPVTDAA
jgi:hypothetical protein